MNKGVVSTLSWLCFDLFVVSLGIFLQITMIIPPILFLSTGKARQILHGEHFKPFSSREDQLIVLIMLALPPNQSFKNIKYNIFLQCTSVATLAQQKTHTIKHSQQDSTSG